MRPIAHHLGTAAKRAREKESSRYRGDNRECVEIRGYFRPGSCRGAVTATQTDPSNGKGGRGCRLTFSWEKIRDRSGFHSRVRIGVVNARSSRSTAATLPDDNSTLTLLFEEKEGTSARFRLLHVHGEVASPDADEVRGRLLSSLFLEAEDLDVVAIPLRCEFAQVGYFVESMPGIIEANGLAAIGCGLDI